MDPSDPYAYVTDPDYWSTSRCEGIRLVKRGPREGEVIGYRYSAWRVATVREFSDVDLTDDQAAAVAAGTRRRPYDLELVHLRGPRIDGEDRVWVQGDGRLWTWLGERFRTCSCHGHPWPCQAYDRDVLVATLRRDMKRKMDGSRPGTCASCREKIAATQQTITFPEPSLIVPGAPGPTFHARRHECWRSAHEYETKLRLPAHPEVDRIASCPGAGFVHEIGLQFECAAGPACTGLHGPYRRDQGNCATRVYRAEDLDAGYNRPLTDCGYRPRWGACLGAETGPCQPPLLRGLFHP